MIWCYFDNQHYRISIYNDFNNTRAYLEYNTYGNGHLEIFNCSVSSGVHRGYQLNTDHIEVYFNHKEVGVFKDKQSAKGLVAKLISECPRECKKDFDAHTEEILEVLK